MTYRVDFLRGVDAVAPGLSRAQLPLLDRLSRMPLYDVRTIEFSWVPGRLVLPFVYTGLPVCVTARRSHLVHIANSWYAHVVPLLRRPSVVTCHDLIDLDALRSGDAVARLHRRFHAEAAFQGLKRATLIVCDSQAVAGHVRRLAAEVSQRIRVVYLGIGEQFRPGAPNVETLVRLGVRQPYVLYVGSEQKRKNLQRLVEAVAVARRRYPALRLVKVGGHQTPSGRADFLDSLHRYNLLNDTTIVESASDQELVSLYRGASLTALVSLQEGFGFPALEAMASGSPTIVSNRDSLPEVTSGNALVVDPLDVRDMAAGIISLCADKDLRVSWGERGARHAATFTWERTASAYAGLYLEALGLQCA